MQQPFARAAAVRQGETSGINRIYCLYREEGLTVRKRARVPTAHRARRSDRPMTRPSSNRYLQISRTRRIANLSAGNSFLLLNPKEGTFHQQSTTPIHPSKGICAKIASAWTEICAFEVAHAIDVARHGDFGAGCQGRLSKDRCDQRGDDLAGGAPQQRAPVAQWGETPNSCERGSVTSAMGKWARIQGFAILGSLAGGARSPIRLFRRLKASSMRQRMR